MPPKRSVTWEFYKKIDSEAAECTICEKVIRYHGSTGNLMDHLRRKHNQCLPIHSIFGSLDSNEKEISPPLPQTDTNLVTDFASTSNVLAGVSLMATDKKMQPKTATLSNQNEPNNSSTLNESRPRKRTRQDSIPDNTKVRELSQSKIKEIDNLLVETVAVGYLPFDLVENQQFIQLFNTLEPRYKLPSRKTLSNNLLNDRYLEIKGNICGQLNETKYVSLSADMWTSINVERFLSVTAHFIHEGELHAAMLATKQISDQHTDENIAQNIRNVINEWKLSSKAFSLVTDNSSMMCNVAKILNLDQLGCAAHNLNLSVNDAFKNTELKDLLDLRQKCQKIIEFFKSSTVVATKLTECQQKLQKTTLKLKQEVPTRWNSTYHMFQRLIQVREELDITFSHVKCNESLTSVDWNVVEDCVSLLEPLYEVTEEISEKKYVTSSIIIPLVRGCQNAIRGVDPNTETGKKLRSQLLDSLSLRMTPYETSICAKATILDPRFKMCGFETTQNATNTINFLISEIEETQSAEGTDEGTSKEAKVKEEKGIETDIVQEKKIKKIWKFVYDQKDKTDTKYKPMSSTEEHMRLYLSKPLIDMEKEKTDAISYWRKHERTMPGLADAAYKYLCVPATSVPSDSIFSKAGQVYSERRNILKAKNVDKIVFLNFNVKYTS